jgi:hypothetical protein
MLIATRPFTHGNRRYHLGDKIEPDEIPEIVAARFRELGLVRDEAPPDAPAEAPPAENTSAPAV